MDIRILNQDEAGNVRAGSITLEASLEFEDLAQLKEHALRALEIEQGLPAEARTPLGNASQDTYVNAFIETRATNDALETYNIIPAAIPRVQTSGLTTGDLYKCVINVIPRPDIGLTTLDPISLKTKRVAKPGFSAKEAEAGGDVEFVDDDKILRRAMIDRLDSELPEPAIRALADDYQAYFEKELAKRNIDPESYRLAHSLNEEQYLLMMARTALNNAHWDYALDAVFVGEGLTLTEEEVTAGFEAEYPGYGAQLMELYELRNELWMMVEKVRREKALVWLRENAIK